MIVKMVKKRFVIAFVLILSFMFFGVLYLIFGSQREPLESVRYRNLIEKRLRSYAGSPNYLNFSDIGKTVCYIPHGIYAFVPSEIGPYRETDVISDKFSHEDIGYWFVVFRSKFDAKIYIISISNSEFKWSFDNKKSVNDLIKCNSLIEVSKPDKNNTFSIKFRG